MKPSGVDAGFRISGADLAGRDVGRCVDRAAFDYDLLPRCAVDAFDREIVLAALAKRRRERAGLDTQGGGDEPAVAGEIGDDRHVEALDLFEDHDRAAAGPLELEDGRGDVELVPDRLADAYQLVRVVALDHRQEAAHALLVHDRSFRPWKPRQGSSIMPQTVGSERWQRAS